MDQASSSLRISAIAPVYCHPDWRSGGVARSSADVAIAMAKRGHSVQVVSPLVDGDTRFPLPKQTSFFNGQLQLHYVRSAKSTRLGTSGKGLKQVMQPLMKQTDIVHIHSFMSPWTDVAASVARGSSVPYIIQDRGKLTPSILNNRSWIKNTYLRLRGLSLLRGAAFVVPLAENIAEAIYKLDPKIRCRVCQNGLDPSEYDIQPPVAPIEEPYVLFLGWLDPRKNILMLIRSFAIIADQVKPWSLALVGPDSYGLRLEAEKLVRDLDIQDRVVFPGLVQGATKLAWLKNAGLFVLPSDGEGLSVAMIEALACGLPCLLSEGCNYPQIEEMNAGRVLDLKEDAWANAMVEWINDPATLKVLSRRARELFEIRHTVDYIAGRLGQIMEEAVGDCRAR